MNKPFRFSMESLYEMLHLVEDISELFSHKDFGAFKVEHYPEAPDNNGPHWKGFRAGITGKSSGKLYIHTGLIFHPDFQKGIYFEVDRKNNRDVYEKLWNNVPDSPMYHVNRDEADYFKFFMPSGKELNRRNVANFIVAAASACLTELGNDFEAVELPEKGNVSYHFKISDLDGLYVFIKLWNSLPDRYDARSHGTNKDNFGDYFAGTRFFVRSKISRRIMYLYGGVLYSDKKQAGIFVEMDEYSNPDTFADVALNLRESSGYLTDRVNPSFIKLFMPESRFNELIIADPESQQKILEDFYQTAVQAFINTIESI